MAKKGKVSEKAFSEVRKAHQILLSLIDESIRTSTVTEAIGWKDFTEREREIWHAAATVSYNFGLRRAAKILANWPAVSAANNDLLELKEGK
jgi:hypothetical protein